MPVLTEEQIDQVISLNIGRYTLARQIECLVEKAWDIKLGKLERKMETQEEDFKNAINNRIAKELVSGVIRAVVPILAQRIADRMGDLVAPDEGKEH